MKIPILCLILFLICTSAFAVVGTQALKLDGSHYVEMKNDKTLNNISKQLTVEARVRVKSFASWWMPVIYKGDGMSPGCSGRSYTLWINQGGSVHFASAPERNSQIFVNSSPGSIRQNRWHHIAGVIDCKTRKMILYLDGHVIARTSYGSRIHQSRLPLRIGWGYENNPEFGYYHGMIDEIRLWNVVRTQNEIRQNIRKPLKGNENGLIGYWTFDDTTSKDHSPSKNHGTLKKGSPRPKMRYTVNRTQYTANRSHSHFFHGLRDIGGIVTADGSKVKEGQVYLSGIPPYDTVLRLAKEGKIRTVISYLLAWEASYQRYNWPRNEVLNSFHFPYGWTNDPNKWARDWNTKRESVIAQLVLQYNTPIREILAVLANEKNYPVLYYCRGGWDRSMIITGILYLALGVSEQQIFEERGKFGVRHQHPRVKSACYNVNKCGGINNYLKSISVPAEHVKNFQRNMLVKN